MTEVANLKRQIARLKAKVEELQAERDVAEMMALDCAPEAAIAYLDKKFPTVTAAWRERNPGQVTP